MILFEAYELPVNRLKQRACEEAYEQDRRRRTGQEKKMMTKARLIKKQEIKEREAQKDSAQKDSESTEVKKTVKQRLGAIVEWPGRTKREDPRKAFADLFAQPQTQ
jgi:hypothetical protein